MNNKDNYKVETEPKNIEIDLGISESILIILAINIPQICMLIFPFETLHQKLLILLPHESHLLFLLVFVLCAFAWSGLAHSFGGFVFGLFSKVGTKKIWVVTAVGIKIVADFILLKNGIRVYYGPFWIQIICCIVFPLFILDGFTKGSLWKSKILFRHRTKESNE